MMKQNGASVYVRAGSAALLLLILGVCGYIGAHQPQTKMVNVPVTRQVMNAQSYAGESLAEIRQRLEESRKEEIDLLDSVLGSPDASEENRQNALAQKIQLASRMETEAQIRAGLAYLGYEETDVLCGAQSVMVFAAHDQLAQERARIQMIDTAASAGQIEPEAVKIILVKK